jgi:transcriptional regulator PpsR
MKGPGRALNPRSIPAAGLDRDAAAALIGAAGDLALVVDRDGVIRDVTVSESREAGSDEPKLWIGKAWVDTVTPESRGKVEAVLRDVAATGSSRRRQVNHTTSDGTDAPVAYTAVRLGAAGGVIAVGRDLRTIAALQQRLVETQQTLERDYWRLRHVETRYRLLFQVSSEAILVVDATSRRIVDANDAAGRLFDKPAAKLAGRSFPIGIDPASEAAVEEAMNSARTVGRSRTVETRLADGGATVEVSISCFRQEAVSLFLVRFTTPLRVGEPGGQFGAEVAELLANAPDAFVMTDIEGRVRSANRAFLDLVELAGEAQAHGRLLSDWIGRPGADLDLFLSILRKHGVVRLATTALRGEHGASSDVEVSASAAVDADEPCIGFIVRDVGRRETTGPRGAEDFTRAVEQMTELVGRVALRDLVRDTTDLVERHFIEAALELTEDNRTAAAEVLGLSRQSLYVKMRRHRLAGAGPDAEEQQAG